MSKQQSGVNNAWDYSKPSVEDYGWHTTERDAALIRSLKDEIERLREALRALVIAVEYKGPPVDFGEGNLCWEARVPLAFVDNARAALGERK